MWPNGTRKWFLDGHQHREDGPAVEWPDGYKEWWLYGRSVTGEVFVSFMRLCPEAKAAFLGLLRSDADADASLVAAGALTSP